MIKIEVVMRHLAHVWSVLGTTLECLANALEVNMSPRALQTLTHGNHVVLMCWWPDFFHFLRSLQTVRCSNYGTMRGDVSYCRDLMRINEGHDNICVETSERPSGETPLRTYVDYNVASALTMCTCTLEPHKCETNSSLLKPCPTLQSPHSSHHTFPLQPVTQSLSQCPFSLPTSSFRLLSTFPVLPRTSTTSLLPTHSLTHLITRSHSTQPHPADQVCEHPSP